MNADKKKRELNESDLLPNYNVLFHILDVSIGILLISDAIFNIATIDSNYFSTIVLSTYYFIFGIVFCTLAFYSPVFFIIYFQIYFQFLGRGIILLLIAIPLFSFGNALDVVFAIYTIVIALLYILCGIFNVFGECKSSLFHLQLPLPLFQMQSGLPSPPNSKKEQKKQSIENKQQNGKHKIPAIQSMTKVNASSPSLEFHAIQIHHRNENNKQSINENIGSKPSVSSVSQWYKQNISFLCFCTKNRKWNISMSNYKI